MGWPGTRGRHCRKCVWNKLARQSLSAGIQRRKSPLPSANGRWQRLMRGETQLRMAHYLSLEESPRLLPAHPYGPRVMSPPPDVLGVVRTVESLSRIQALVAGFVARSRAPKRVLVRRIRWKTGVPTEFDLFRALSLPIGRTGAQVAPSLPTWESPVYSRLCWGFRAPSTQRRACGLR